MGLAINCATKMDPPIIHPIPGIDKKAANELVCKIA